nr:hypothetical protein BaRGS_022486 [Batillaria attramentaria]
MVGPVYEMRIYRFNVRGNIEFSKTLDQKFWDLRQKFSKVIGIWRTELNGISEFIHIAEYDDLDHLFRVRQSMQSDKEWHDSLKHLVDLQWSFQNALLAPVPGSKLSLDFKRSDSAAYELQTVPEGSKMLVLEYRLVRYPDKCSALSDAMNNRQADSGQNCTCH